MMMTLGFFVFNRSTLPYQSQQHDKAWRHPTHSRVGARPASQYIGPDAENMTLSGVLLPEITGGRVSLEMIERMADTGRAYPLIDGTGVMHGLFVIQSLSTTRTEFFRDGAARRIEFTLTLMRVDDNDRGLMGWLDLNQLGIPGLGGLA